jgi:outer membrane protein OmpA-like peptidoglycan-associated protein
LVPLALLLAVAHAAESADVALIRPTFSTGALPGLDSPEIRRWEVEAGALVGYERSPLVVYQLGWRVGDVVEHRVLASLGVGVGITRHFAARAVLPVAVQLGTDIPALAPPPVGLGDLSIGARVGVMPDRLGVGAHADLFVPTGTRGAWLGEAAARTAVGVDGLVRVGRFDVQADVGVLLRAPVQTGHDLVVGHEVIAKLGGVARVAGPLSVGVAIPARVGLYGPAVDTLVVEPLALVRVRAGVARLELGVAKGLGVGYGGSAFRVFAGVARVTRPPEPRPVPPKVEPTIEDLPDELPPPPPVPPAPIAEAEPPPSDWAPGELARVRLDRIEIRDRLQFEFGTARLLDVSRPVLAAVAALLRSEGRIAHVVIEGHASEEGGFAYNYQLSLSRCLTVYQVLVESGVHPDRLSVRGSGEVVPLAGARDLEDNRRVEFHIVREATEALPPVDATIALPWTGDPVPVHTPGVEGR